MDTLGRRQAHAATQEPVEREYGAELVFRVLHIAGSKASRAVTAADLAIVHSEGLDQLQRWETNTDVSWGTRHQGGADLLHLELGGRLNAEALVP